MRIPNKFNGYSADGRRLYPGGGGGPTQTTSYQTNIPEYARPYVEQMLGATQRQLFTGTSDAQGQFTPTGFKEYMPYGATFQTDAQGNPMRDAQGRIMYTNTAQQQAQAAVAPMSTLQQQAMMGIGNYVNPQQGAAASQIAGNVAGQSAASGYYSPLVAERFQLGKPQQVYSDSFTAPGVSQAYMSPYMQNVVAAQQREARRAGEMQRMQNQAQAVGQGAYGGSRQAIVEAERQRNLATQLGDIQAQGLQQAYGQGMGQFNAEQAAYLQAQQANQSANLQAAIQNLQSQQQAQAAQEASRQFGAQLGLQGYGQALNAAQLLGQQGQQEYQQDMSTLQAQMQAGGLDQAQQQQVINQAIQNYATGQQYPLMQLGVMSNMLRGLPMQASTSQMYQAQPSGLAQAAGAIGTGLGLVQQYNKAFPGGKEGGVVKKMAAGGIATGVPEGKLQAMVKGFSDKDITGKIQDPETDAATKEVMTAEMARRQHLRSSMPKMAPGGIVAFAGKKSSVVKDKKSKEDIPTDTSNIPGQPVSDVYPEEFERGSAAGIAQAMPEEPATPDAAAIANADVEKGMQTELARLKPIAERPLAEQVKMNQQAREQQGVPSPYATEMQQITERRTKAKDEEKETAQDRLINFLTRWGTLPGPTLVAMNRAGVEMIEKSELDRKEQRKLLAQLDESERQINRAEYSRKLGEEDRARQEIKEAGQMYFKVSQDLMKHKYDLAMKDADFKKALEVAKAQHPKSDELGIQVMYEGLVAQDPKKFPPGPVTRMLAAQAWQASKPGVVSTQMGLGYHSIQAGAAADQASAAQQNAKTRQDEERRKQKEDWRRAVRDVETFDDDNRKALAQTRAKDAAAKIDPKDPNSATSKLKTKLHQDLYDQGGFELLPRPGGQPTAPKTDTAPNPLAGKKPEPKKDEKKKDLSGLSAFDKK